MATTAADNGILPPVRGELRLVGRRRDASGAEVHVVYDPLRHRFFEFLPLAAAMLRHWRTGSRAALLDRVNTESGQQATAEDVDDMVRYLGLNQLLRSVPPNGRPSWFARLERLIGALFLFRIPLVHPDRVLGVLGALLLPLMGRATLIGMALLAGTGLLLVLRQWDLFLDSLRPAVNVGGAVAMVLAVALAKAIHELGHALAAKAKGCRVPTMGVAFMFGAPLLYTDLSDTWRLSRRRDRLLVAAGGILAELTLAALATWGWLILPDGPGRSACFFLASAAWIATLAVNLNPFMRFDGYFMLSDLLGVPNLQERGFALGRWKMRRLLWGLPDPCPDDAPPRLVHAMIAYAWSTWAFRGSLYIGLAFAVFHLLPKAVAVPLLLSELWVLVMRPVVHELAVWWKRRAELAGTGRGRFTLGVLAALLLCAAIPQRFDLALPAVAAPEQRHWVHPSRAARLVEHMAEGAMVAEGDMLARFEDAELSHQILQSRGRLAILTATEEQAARSQSSARELAVLRERVATEAAQLSGLEAQEQALRITAPFAGRVTEMTAGRIDGRWFAPTEPLFLLTATGQGGIVAFVDDRDLPLLRPGGNATFHPAAIDRPVLSAVVETVEQIPSETIAEPLLASVSGGPIATERDAAGRAVPLHGQYRVSARLTAPPAADLPALLGTLVVASERHSLLGLLWKRLHMLFAKEFSA